MEMSTIALFVFFLGGVSAHIFARLAFPWKPQHQPWFWLATMGMFGITLFILAGNVDKKLVEALNAILAGACISEYIRLRYQTKLAKVAGFGKEVAGWKRKEAARSPKGKTRKPRHKDH